MGKNKMNEGLVTIWDVWRDITKSFTELSKSLDKFSRMLPEERELTHKK